MGKKRYSFVITVILVGGLVLWYIFMYYPKNVEINDLKLQINKMRTNLISANQANVDIGNIENKLAEAKNRLQSVRERFVDKGDLANVSKKVRDVAKNYNLKLTDFAPVVEDYFADTVKTDVKALPLAIVVRGRYLDVGRFIENWGELPFYLEAKEIAIKRVSRPSNEVEATISSKLYSWNR